MEQKAKVKPEGMAKRAMEMPKMLENLATITRRISTQLARQAKRQILRVGKKTEGLHL